MRVDPQTRTAISGANSDIRFPLECGRKIEMPNPGIWMSLDPEHVQDHYAVHDHNVLMSFEFDPADVIRGNLTDNDTEFTVLEAILHRYELLPAEL